MFLSTVTGGADAVLLDLLVILIAAKLAAEAAERMRVPSVLAEILAGIAVGPSVLGLVGGGDVVRVLAELGVILLLLQVGMEMDLDELGAVGRTSLLVAVAGVALPFVGGLVVATVAGLEMHQAIFMGAALTATSVGITARVFADLKALATVEARVVLGAAVADDVLGLVILTVVVRLVAEGGVSVFGGLSVLALAVLFLALTGAVGLRIGPRLVRAVHARARSAGTLLVLAVAFTLAVAQLATLARLAPIVGAFVAGLALGRSDHAERIREDLTPLSHLLVPVFFVQIGLDTDIAQLARPEVLGLAAALLAVGVVGKLASSVGAVGSVGDKALIGLGMLPRGEVGLIFAGLGLREGVLGENLYASLLLVVLGTTLATPPLLRWRLLRLRAGPRRAASTTPAPGRTPEGGWLHVVDGAVELRAEPPPHLALRLGLQAASLAGGAHPGRSLLDWFGALGDAPLRWDRGAGRELLTVLRAGNARSWRFLEAIGLLDRIVPELADTLNRRREQASDLDPAHVVHWTLLEQAARLAKEHANPGPEQRRLDRNDALLLAALLLDVAGGDEAPVAAARQLVKRLDLGAAVEQEVAALVGAHRLLRAAAIRPDALEERVVLELASHLGRPERARALYLLTLAGNELERWERLRLDELHSRVQAVLARPDVSGREARNLAEQRRAAALRHVTGPEAAERLVRAPRSWLLSQDAPALAAQATLLSSRHRLDTPRVAVTAVSGDAAPPAPPPTPPGAVGAEEKPSTGPAPARWRVDVVCRDRTGGLSRVTGVLAETGSSVADATTATWDDASALMSFHVTGPHEPDVAQLEARITAAMTEPLRNGVVPDARVTFDDDASPWTTLCHVDAPDRPGLLRDLTAAIAFAGASIRAATVATENGIARDTFELTDRRGQKLTPEVEDALQSAVTDGAAAESGGARGRRAAQAGMPVGGSSAWRATLSARRRTSSASPR